jgi:parvulin-like peptidyl-prolyl isomerase
MRHQDRHQKLCAQVWLFVVGPVALAGIVAALALGCGRPGRSPEVVAASDLGETTRTDLDAFTMLQPEGRRQPAPRQDPLAWRRETLRDLLTARALEAEARSSGLAEAPETTMLLEARRDEVLAETAQQRWIQQHVNITQDDLRAFYEAHPEEFRHDEQVRVRNIFLRVDRDAPPSERQKVRLQIEGLLQQIRNGADFGELAALHSQSETASLQGLIGKLSRGTLTPAIEDVIWGLDEGEVSEVVETPTGFHIFRVDDRLPAEQRALEEVSGALTRKLTREATEAALAVYLDDLIVRSGAFFNPGAVLDGDDPEAVVFQVEDEVWTVTDWWARFEGQPFFAQREVTLADQLDRFAMTRLAVWDGTNQDLASGPEVAARLAAVERATLIELAMQERRKVAVGSISEQDLLAYWESQRRSFQQPKLHHLRLITRRFPDDPKLWYGVYEDLIGVAADIRAGRRDFAEEARRTSDDVSAHRGGDVGLVRLDSVGEWAGPNASKAIGAMAEGEISDPILIERFHEQRFTYQRDGYMLVAVDEIQPARLLAFDEAREKVIDRYIREGSPEVNTEIQDQILASIHAVIFEDHL